MRQKTRVCSLCKTEKPISEFCKDRQNKDGLNRKCRSCNTKSHRRWRKRFPDSYKRSCEKVKADRKARRLVDPEWAELIRERNREANRALDPLKKRKRRFIYHLRGKFKMTLEEYAELYDAAGGQCQICGTAIAPEHLADELQEGVKRNLDHDHETGHVRGLLCGLCNRGLGYLGENPKNYLRAARYLARHEKVCVHKSRPVRAEVSRDPDLR